MVRRRSKPWPCAPHWRTVRLKSSVRVSRCVRRAGPQRPGASSITIDFDQALVTDAEVVGYFMEDNPPHLPAKALRVLPVETHERAAIDRDLVRQHFAVVAVASG